MVSYSYQISMNLDLCLSEWTLMSQYYGTNCSLFLQSTLSTHVTVLAISFHFSTNINAAASAYNCKCKKVFNSAIQEVD